MKKTATKKVTAKKPPKKKTPQSIILYALDYDKYPHTPGVIGRDGDYSRVNISNLRHVRGHIYVRAELVDGYPTHDKISLDALAKAKPRPFETVLNTVPYIGD